MSVEDSPEFKAALQAECERQYRSYLYGGNVSSGKVGGTAEEVEAQRREIEEKVKEARLHAERIRREAELMSNEGVREITQHLRRIHGQDGGRVCPQCGETDSHGNTVNGKPFCFKCQLPMISKEKAEKWIKPSKPKIKSYTFTDYEFARVRK